jgi:ribosomal protein L29
MTKDELKQELVKEQQDYIDTKFNTRIGKHKDYAALKLQRKKIAQIYTVLKLKKINKSEIRGILQNIKKSKPVKKTKLKTKNQKVSKNKKK